MVDTRLHRLFDLVCASVAVIVLLPLLLVTALLVKMTSSGPVLYCSRRAGKLGVPFTLIKFRSMVHDAESIGGGSTAKDDARITGFGKILRRYKIDELPQLFNVLRGDMSLVGPRPEPLQYIHLYTEEERRVILNVRPGLTDLASIEFIQLGNVLGNDDPESIYTKHVLPQKNVLRIQYLRQRTLRGDVTIILHTLLKLISLLIRPAFSSSARILAWRGRP